MDYEGIALTIAGSDSGGGAGIQADLKTFAAFNVYGASVITSITAQNTKEVIAIFDIPPEIVEKQLDAVLSDIKVNAVKTGMLSNKEIIRTVARGLSKYEIKNIVVDPVMVAKSGSILLKKDAIESLIREILPLSLILTPNKPEAEVLSGIKIEAEDDIMEAARVIKNLGVRYVLIKGGHLGKETSTDFLFDGKEFYRFSAEKIQTKNTHGTGCSFSSAIAAGIAKGKEIYEAVKDAKEYITMAIKEAPSNIGHGFGPVYHNIKV